MEIWGREGRGTRTCSNERREARNEIPLLGCTSHGAFIKLACLPGKKVGCMMYFAVSLKKFG